MVNVSSQDFRNAYEKFYNSVRRYLWPMDVLEQLSNVEVDIYDAFIDINKLNVDFSKMKSLMKDTIKEDKVLDKTISKIEDLLNDRDASSYLRLPRVNEVNPEKAKSIKTIFNDEED